MKRPRVAGMSAQEAGGMERLALRPAEAAKALGLHVQTVRALVDSGRLGAVRVGKRIVIPASAIAKFLNESETKAQVGGAG
jgi:excisionase family DNA binding protein